MDDHEFPPEQRNLSQRELCELEGTSPATLYKLTKQGLGPQWTVFPGTNAKRLTPAARAEWHERMEAWNFARAAKLAAARKAQIETMSMLGKMGAQSPKHPCRQHGKKRGR